MEVSDLSSCLLFPVVPRPRCFLNCFLCRTSTLFQTLPSAHWTCLAQSLTSSALLGDLPPTTDILGLGEWIPLQTGRVHWRLQCIWFFFLHIRKKLTPPFIKSENSQILRFTKIVNFSVYSEENLHTQPRKPRICISFRLSIWNDIIDIVI